MTKAVGLPCAAEPGATVNCLDADFETGLRYDVPPASSHWGEGKPRFDCRVHGYVADASCFACVLADGYDTLMEIYVIPDEAGGFCGP